MFRHGRMGKGLALSGRHHGPCSRGSAGNAGGYMRHCVCSSDEKRDTALQVS